MTQTLRQQANDGQSASLVRMTWLRHILRGGVVPGRVLRGRVLPGRVGLAARVALGLRALTASIALFAVLGVEHVLPAVHFALVAHRLCAEHGELLHESAAVAEPSSSSSDVSFVARDIGSHEHEHCGVLALPSSLALPVSFTASSCRIPKDSDTAIASRARRAYIGIDLLSYAPKLAPPA